MRAELSGIVGKMGGARVCVSNTEDAQMRVPIGKVTI